MKTGNVPGYGDDLENLETAGGLVEIEPGHPDHRRLFIGSIDRFQSSNPGLLLTPRDAIELAHILTGWAAALLEHHNEGG